MTPTSNSNCKHSSLGEGNEACDKKRERKFPLNEFIFLFSPVKPHHLVNKNEARQRDLRIYNCQLDN